MTTPDRDETRHLYLRRFWDDIVQGGPATPGDLDPALSETIRRLHALADSPAPDAARERVWRSLPGADRPLQQESPMELILTMPSSWPSPNGRAAPVRRLPALPLPARQRRWAVGQVATVAMLVLTLVGTYFVFRSASPSTQDQPPTFADVPNYKANAGRTGENPGPGPVGEPVELWRIEVEQPSAPAVVGGVLYVGSSDGQVRALDAATGEVRWTFATGDPVRTGSLLGPSPTVADGVVYVPGGDRSLYALDAATSAERWRLADFGDEVGGVVVDGVLYAGTEAGLLALDAATGAERWRYTAGGEVNRNPATVDGVVYAINDVGMVIAVNAADGTLFWQYRTDGGSMYTPAVSGGIVYQSTAFGPADRLYAIDAATGVERWRFSIGVPVYPPTVGGGLIYVTTDDRALYALDAASGAVRWRVTAQESLSVGPALAGDTLYVAAGDGSLTALDAASGSERWHVQVGVTTSNPVVTGGVIFVTLVEGAVVALGDPGAAGGAPASGGASTPRPLAGGAPVEYLWQSTGGPQPLVKPADVAIHPLDGSVWVLDIGHGHVQILSPDGRYLETWGEVGAGDGQLNLTQGGSLVFDAAGNFYVAEVANRRVQRFDRERNFVLAWDGSDSAGGPFVSPETLAIDTAGNVYVAEIEGGFVHKFDGDGRWLLTFGEPGSGSGQLNFPSFPAVDAQGNLYVAEVRNNRISKFASDGAFVSSWGTAGTGEGRFRAPNGVAVDAAGNVYVADGENQRVQVFDAAGQFQFLWEGADLGDDFGWIASVELDGQGNIFVADITKGRVLKFRLLPPLAPAAVSIS